MHDKMLPFTPVDFSQEWKSAYENADFDALRDMYEPDAQLMTRDRPAKKGVEEIIEYFKTSRQSGSKFEIEFENESGHLDYPYYFQVSKWWLRGTNADGIEFQDSGRSLVIFKKRNEHSKWRIWMDIDNRTPDVTIENKPEDKNDL